MAYIQLITGGQRSGKSEEAERRALALSDHPLYMATAHVWDEEFRTRVQQHQARRGPQWTTIEEEMWLSRHDVTGRVVLVDCCTLWATNFFFHAQSTSSSEGSTATAPAPSTLASTPPLPDAEAVARCLTEEFDRLVQQDATFLFVTNEIGLGGVAENAIQRRFTDVMGRVNQYIAAHANEMVLMVSGIPLTLKHPSLANR